MAKKEKVEKEVPAKLTRTVKTDVEEVESMDSGTKTDKDYLRPYQYKKVNGVPVLGNVAGKLTDPDKGSKAEGMKAHLLAQKKVTVMIPVDSGSDPSVPFDVTLNGYRLSLPRNQYLEVPEQVAGVIMQSHSQTQVALSRDRVDGNKAKETALS